MIFIYATIIEIIVIYILIGYYIKKYSQTDVPLYLKIIIFLSCALAFTPIPILALDIDYNKNINDIQNLINNRNILGINIIWNLIYWISFIMTWIVLPFFLEYH